MNFAGANGRGFGRREGGKRGDSRVLHAAGARGNFGARLRRGGTHPSLVGSTRRSHASLRSHTPAATWPAAVAASVATTEKRSIAHSAVHSNSKFNNKGNRTPR